MASAKNEFSVVEKGGTLREDSAREVDVVKAKELVDNERDLERTNTVKKGWFGGAGSLQDAWLTSAAAQIGQVMLALPNAVAKTGLRAGIPLVFAYAAISMYTIHLMDALYCELKARKIKDGKWEGGHTRRATQYYDVLGYLCGKWVGRFVLVITLISLMSTSVAQVIAIATGMYYLVDSVDKRIWTLASGALLTFGFSFVPTFRHFRFLNVIAIVGTFYTAIYLITTAAKEGVKPGAYEVGPRNMRNLFLGGNVFMSAFGGHTMSFEVIDAMFQPSKYDVVYPFSYIFTAFVTFPHSILVQFAYPTTNIKYGNVYGLVPVNAARDVSIVLMIIHQCVAYAIYLTPVFFMWEKLIRTHSKPLWIRLPSRLPVALLVWLLGIMLPFYDTINAIMGAFGNAFTAFVFPTAAYLWVYRTSEARANAPKQPPRLLGGWTGVMTLNIVFVIYFAVFGVGFGVWASIAQLVDQISNLGVFAACYQCASIQASNARG